MRTPQRVPARHRHAAEHIVEIAPDIDLESWLGDVAIPLDLADLVEFLAHHERVQADELPNGERPWFEPVRDGG